MMDVRWQLSIFLLLSLWRCFLARCGGGPTPVGVSGTVTLDGQPLPQGTISFEQTALTAGQRRGGMIVDGEFDLPSSEGVLSGLKFNVVIHASRKMGRKYPNAYGAPFYDETVQYIPAQYNTATTLRAKFSPNEQENQLLFDLVSK